MHHIIDNSRNITTMHVYLSNYLATIKPKPFKNALIDIFALLSSSLWCRVINIVCSRYFMILIQTN